MPEAIIAVIGGSGLGEALARDQQGETIHLDTPFGATSSPILLTRWQDQKVAFLSRHGDGHLLNPSQVPYRANIFALKKLGVTHILASGAAGSLRQDLQPREVVIADQVIDRTYKRANTFFEQHIAVHVEFAHPFCPQLRQLLVHCGAELQARVHDGGTYVCMEGPQFSTVAESHLHRAWGGDLIGMTCMPEAKLAREAEICYALLALPTDYDCWRPHDPDQDHTALLEEILQNLKIATDNALQLIQKAVPQVAGCLDGDCPCRQALKLGIWSQRSKLDRKELAALEPLLNKYVAFSD